MAKVFVKIQKTSDFPEGVELPFKATEGAAGCDVCSIEEVLIPTGKVVSVRTGIRVAIPDGYEMQVRSRSGLARKQVSVANSPGTIDSDYRGEIMISLHNFSGETFKVEKGMRIAQLLVAEVPELYFVDAVVDEKETKRGAGGFGSTGLMS